MGKTILELFKTEIITFLDNGKAETAEQHFAIRNSKDIPIEPKNPLLNPAFKLRDIIQKRTSRRDRETLLEEETGGLRALMLLSGPVIYGTDIIRLKKRTTDSRDLMVSKANGGGGSRGLLTGVLNFAKNAPKKLGSLLGAKFPEQMIPSRFIDNKNFKAGSSDLPDQISKILKESEGNGFGRFLQSSVTGTPQQIGNQIVTKGLGEIKNVVNQALFGSRKEGAVNLAKKPSNKRYYDAYSLYSDVVDEQNTDVKLRNDLSQKFNAFQFISKGGGIFGPPTFAKRFLDVNQNNQVLTSLYQEPYFDKTYGSNERIFYNAYGNKAAAFSASSKRGIKLLGDSFNKNPRNIFYNPKDTDTGLPIDYSERIDLNWGPNSTTTIENRNDLSTLMDSYIFWNYTSNINKIKYNVGLNDKGVPINMGLYPKYSTTNIDPIATGNTKGYDIQRGIELYREIDLVDKTTGVRSGDTLNKVGVRSSNTYTSVIGGTTKTLDEIDFITLKFISSGNKYVYFRGTINSFSETFTPGYAQHQGVGQAYPFYTLETVERSIQFNFKVYSHNGEEHKQAWERLQFLAHQTMPQGYAANGGTNPPLIKFTLGDMFKEREAFIETLNYTTDQNFPWEIGLNSTGSLDLNCYKLPMIIDVSVTLHLIDEESDVNAGTHLYSFWKPNSQISRTTNPAVGALAVNPNSIGLPVPGSAAQQIKRIPASVAVIPTPRPNLSVGKLNLPTPKINITLPSSIPQPPAPVTGTTSSTTDTDSQQRRKDKKQFRQSQKNSIPQDTDETKFPKKHKNNKTNSTKNDGVIDYIEEESKQKDNISLIKRGEKVNVTGVGVAADVNFAKMIAALDGLAKARNVLVIDGVSKDNVEFKLNPINTITEKLAGGKTMIQTFYEAELVGLKTPNEPGIFDSKYGVVGLPPNSEKRKEAEKQLKKDRKAYKREKKAIEAWNSKN